MRVPPDEGEGESAGWCARHDVGGWIVARVAGGRRGDKAGTPCVRYGVD